MEEICFIAGVKEESHALELGLEPKLGRWSLVRTSTARFSVISRLALEQHSVEQACVLSLTGDISEAFVAQQEDSPSLSICLQRQSARSRAAFHSARDSFNLIGGVD